MKLDKNQKQYIVLGALVLIVLGYLSITLMNGSRSDKKASKSENTTATETASIPAGNVDAPLITLAPLSRRDPFMVPRQPSLSLVPSTNTKQLGQPQNLEKKFGSIKPVNPWGSKPLPPISPMQRLTTGSTVQKRIEPNMKLSGIVRGVQNMAVIRIDGTPYFVRQGDTFAGNYKLVAVLRESVMLERNGTTKRVILGGKNNDN